MRSTHDLVSRIRDLVNESETQSLLIKNQGMWRQLASSLDVISDCEMAFTAYLSRFPSGRDATPVDELGDRYLRTYGVLQALYVQQDGLSHLCESLDVTADRDDYPDLKAIRDIRNRAIGHPTKRRFWDRKKPPSYHGIVQISLTDESFQVYSDWEGEGRNLETVNVPTLIEHQRASAAQVLGGVIALLEAARN